MKPVACACAQCRRMCAISTCLPDPEGARALIRAGHGHRLATYRWREDPERMRYIGPAPAGMEGARDLPATRGLGSCTFFDGKDCELHAAGLKPLEGRIALHDRSWQPVRVHVMGTWRGRQFDSVLSALNRAQALQEP